MKTYSKSVKLDNISYDIRGPVLDEAELMEARGEKVLKLNTGNPGVFGFHVPDYLTSLMQNTLTKADAYSASKGIIEAREAIAEYSAKKGLFGVTPGDIYTGNGVSELIMMCMQGLLDTGDEILIPTPDYPLWTASATLAGGTVVHYICDEKNNWYPDIEDIRKKITPRTKGIVVINPNNPTGVLYPREILEQIVELAKEHELILFADEIYDRLVMDGKEHVALGSISDEVFTVTLNGLSKSHRAAGFRVGWMSLSGRKEHVRGYIQGITMLSSMRLCSNVPAQHIIAPALRDTTPDYDLMPGGRIYEQRELLYTELNKIPGISVVRPDAAFYMFPKIDTERFNITSDEQFVLDFLRKEKIMLVHGGGFHLETPDHFRIVYLPNVNELKDFTDKLGNFLSDYKQN